MALLNETSIRLRNIVHCFHTIGCTPALGYAWRRVRKLAGWEGVQVFQLRTRQVPHPIAVRPKTSDLGCFKQIFVQRQYQCVGNLAVNGLIMDCGANVGYASVYFLREFPAAHLLAIEPDPGNYELLKMNLSHYQLKAESICGAIWPQCGALKLSPEYYRDGMEWSRQVRWPRPGEVADVRAYDIQTLLHKTGFTRIALLKIDIERSELGLFTQHPEDWLNRVDNLVIELHDEECRAVFMAKAVKTFAQISEWGELTVCAGNKLTAN